MGERYLGRLEYKDPLYGYMVDDVMPRAGREARDPVFHVCRMDGTNLVYKYHEPSTELTMVGKFYSFQRPDKALRLKGEFDNLNRARALGMTSLPNYVVRPLGHDEKTGLGLLEEYVPGKDLDHYIRRAIYDGRVERLKERLGDLAFFLAQLHKNAGPGRPLEMGPSGAYFDKVLRKLLKQGVLDRDTAGRFGRLKEVWLARECMHLDQEVLTHGDATVTNFIFPSGSGVVAIDLERMREGDRMFDVGMIGGELKHAFMWRTGDQFAAEQFIAHFLREYSGRFWDPDRMFWSVVRRNPFYMAMTELRIARNGWLDWGHRQRLVREAERCLTWGLRLG